MNQGPVLNNAMQEAVRVDPSLTTLFGSQDYCAVDDCTTVLSPARTCAICCCGCGTIRREGRRRWMCWMRGGRISGTCC